MGSTKLCKAPWIKALYKCTIYHLYDASASWFWPRMKKKRIVHWAEPKRGRCLCGRLAHVHCKQELVLSNDAREQEKTELPFSDFIGKHEFLFTVRMCKPPAVYRAPL